MTPSSLLALIQGWKLNGLYMSGIFVTAVTFQSLVQAAVRCCITLAPMLTECAENDLEEVLAQCCRHGQHAVVFRLCFLQCSQHVYDW